MFIVPPNLELPGIRAFFTTKRLAPPELEIDKVLAKELSIPRENIYLPIQRHTNRVQLIGSDPEAAEADAVITDKMNRLIGVIVADCVPVLLCDGKRGIVAAVHAGWRGTAKEILKITVDTMTKKYGSMPEDTFVAIGPSIRKCSYEVGDEVVREVKKATGEGEYCCKKEGRYFIDLAAANRIQALRTGIPEENIWQSQDCTFCNPDKYYSYRYSGRSSGRQGGFIGMW